MKATFSEAGTYKITLSLVDLIGGDETIITQRDIFVDVLGEHPVEELPQTGTSIWNYLICSIAGIGIVFMGYLSIKKRIK